MVKKVKKRVSGIKKNHVPARAKEPSKRKKAFGNLLIFFFLSLIFYYLSTNIVDGNLSKVFWFFGFITGALALAFLIALLVLLFKKLAERKL